MAMPGIYKALNNHCFPVLNISAEQEEQGLALRASCLAEKRPANEGFLAGMRNMQSAVGTERRTGLCRRVREGSEQVTFM